MLRSFLYSCSVPHCTLLCWIPRPYTSRHITRHFLTWQYIHLYTTNNHTLYSLLQFLHYIRTGLFSATQTKELKELARAGLRNPVSVTVQVSKKTLPPCSLSLPSSTSSSMDNEKEEEGSGKSSVGHAVQGKIVQQATPSSLDNFYSICPYDERPVQLALFVMRNLKSKIIVFCSTCACVDYFSEAFSKMTRAAATAKKTKTVKTPLSDNRDDNKEDSKGESNVSSVDKEAKSSSSSSSSSSSPSSYLPSCINVLGFHGKMVPKRRALLYKKFQSLSSGVLFCTDIAARGIDFPDVDFIVQLSAPKGTYRCWRHYGAIVCVHVCMRMCVLTVFTLNLTLTSYYTIILHSHLPFAPTVTPSFLKTTLPHPLPSP